MHPVVEPGSGQPEFDGAKQFDVAAIDERVEYPDFDLRMRGQRSDLLVAVDRVTVVDQQPHAHAAVGGTQQRIGQQAGRFRPGEK